MGILVKVLVRYWRVIDKAIDEGTALCVYN